MQISPPTRRLASRGVRARLPQGPSPTSEGSERPHTARHASRSPARRDDSAGLVAHRGRSTRRHRVFCIEEEVQENLLQLALVAVATNNLPATFSHPTWCFLQQDSFFLHNTNTHLPVHLLPTTGGQASINIYEVRILMHLPTRLSDKKS